MSDLISRQAAIEEVAFGITYAVAIDKTTGEKKELFQEGNNELRKAINRIEQMPSAQPERKNGKWIIKDNPGTGWYRVACSECGEDVTSEIPMIGFPPNAKALWDFCPYCGTEMRGEK